MLGRRTALLTVLNLCSISTASLIVVIDWDHRSNQDSPPGKQAPLYVILPNELHVGKKAVKHDDRLDALAQGIKYFTDALHISAQEQIKDRKQEEFANMLAEFLDDPQASANHMCLGMTLEQREESRGRDTGTSPIPNWR